MKSLKQRLKSNGGYTMVELLVVLALMAVVYGVGSLSLAIQPTSEAKKVTLSINSMFSRTKTSTLAKSGNAYMEIHHNAAGELELNYYETYTDDSGVSKDVLREGEVLTKYGTIVEYVLSSGGDAKTLAKGESLVFMFNRQTMGFRSLEDGYDTIKASGITGKSSITGEKANTTCTEIIVIASGGDGISYTITLGPTTGTHYTNLK